MVVLVASGTHVGLVGTTAAKADVQASARVTSSPRPPVGTEPEGKPPGMEPLGMAVAIWLLILDKALPAA